jgi:2'-5' RNA ligase
LQVIGDVHFPAFKLRLDRTGYWPSSGSAWLGPSVCPLELDSLVDGLWNKLDGLGFVREDLRPYTPHVSLCRNVTGNSGVQLERSVEWPVTSFGLAKSSAATGAPVYTILEQFPAGD